MWLALVLAGCGPQPFLSFWEWNATDCQDGPCWGRVLLVQSEVTYERDPGIENVGRLTEIGRADLDDSLRGLCSLTPQRSDADHTVTATLDCGTDTVVHTYDFDDPPKRIADLDALMAEVVMALQTCRSRDTTVPDIRCDHM